MFTYPDAPKPKFVHIRKGRRSIYTANVHTLCGRMVNFMYTGEEEGGTVTCTRCLTESLVASSLTVEG